MVLQAHRRKFLGTKGPKAGGARFPSAQATPYLQALENAVKSISRVPVLEIVYDFGQGSVLIVPTFVPTLQTDGHIGAHPATCYDHD
jgi:hypothetical protein